MKKYATLLLMFSLLFSFGCENSVPTNPTQQDSGDTGSAFSDVTLGKRLGAASQSSFYSFEDFSQIGESMSEIIRYEKGVRIRAKTTGLEPGAAATLWLVVFNEPGQCTDNICGDDLEDFTQPHARPEILYVDGAVADENGQIRFSGKRRVGDSASSIMQDLMGAPGFGFEDASSAELHLVVRDHGPVIPGMEVEMLTTFGGGCDDAPADGSLGQPGPNTCADIQYAEHKPVN